VVVVLDDGPAELGGLGAQGRGGIGAAESSSPVIPLRQ
jgi:hypothetical protein